VSTWWTLSLLQKAEPCQPVRQRQADRVERVPLSIPPPEKPTYLQSPPRDLGAPKDYEHLAQSQRLPSARSRKRGRHKVTPVHR